MLRKNKTSISKRIELFIYFGHINTKTLNTFTYYISSVSSVQVGTGMNVNKRRGQYSLKYSVNEKFHDNAVYKK